MGNAIHSDRLILCQSGFWGIGGRWVDRGKGEMDMPIDCEKYSRSPLGRIRCGFGERDIEINRQSVATYDVRLPARNICKRDLRTIVDALAGECGDHDILQFTFWSDFVKDDSRLPDIIDGELAHCHKKMLHDAVSRARAILGDDFDSCNWIAVLCEVVARYERLSKGQDHAKFMDGGWNR